MADHVEKRGSSKNKRTGKQERVSYDANFKLIVVNFAEQQNNSKASRHFNISEANIRRWRKEKKKLKYAHSTRKAFRGPKKGVYKEVDEVVLKFVQEMRKKGFSVSREAIRMKALEEATRRKIPRTQFKASIGWSVRFMRRNGLALRRRTTLAQRLPTDFEEKLVQYQRYVIRLRQEHDYLLGHIGNADETPAYFDMPANCTISEKGEKSVLVKTTGNEKLRVTVVFTVLGDGRKLPPFVILKRKTPPKEKLPKGIIFKWNETGWMTEDMMICWLDQVWNKRPGVLLKRRGMLILDAFKGHLTDKVKTHVAGINTDLVIIPGGMTSQLQVLDVIVNKPFKDHLRQQYGEWLLSDNCPLTPKGNIKRPSGAQLGEWIKS